MDEYKSLLSGFISGGIHTIVGYPLDTLKTLKQSTNEIKNQNQNLILKPKKIIYKSKITRIYDVKFESFIVLSYIVCDTLHNNT